MDEIQVVSAQLRTLIAEQRAQLPARPKGHHGLITADALDDLARRICEDLLEAAQVEDQGGCPLCQG